MKNIYVIILFCWLFSCTNNQSLNLQSSDSSQNQLISQPVTIQTDQAVFVGTENIMLVPENRSNESSRMIALHFFRFKARQTSELPPVIFLGAGPGEPYDVEHFFESEYGNRAKSWVWELAFVNQYRDLILINQRGNPESPGLAFKDFEFRYKNGLKDQPFDWALRNKNRAQALQKYIAVMEQNAVDVRGYGILEMIEDIESIRAHYQDKKLALIGTSFGSQWALAYMRKYPGFVDRAILAGVEPVARNHDKPSDRWRVLEKIAKYAEADPNINADLPQGGLLAAYQRIIKRFEQGPINVSLNLPELGIDESIVLGVDDFRMGYRNPYARGRLEGINSWPKYITEIDSGDLRTLALRSRGRDGTSKSLALAALVDKSLGISKNRSIELQEDPASRWLGPINGYLDEFLTFDPDMDVGNEFRQQQPSHIPVIMIQGDMDLNTPIENAKYLQKYFSRNHLITVKRGTHTAKRALILSDSIMANNIYQFMNEDFESQPFHEFKTTLPTVVELPEFDFWPINGESLLDKYTKD